MKVAVITPHWKTPVQYLRRNLESVAWQETGHEIHHFLVADGYDCDEQEAVIKSFPKTTSIRLPVDCNDVGATPSVIGAYIARSLGYEGYFFLGDDNIFVAEHIESCVSKHLETKADVVASKRFFMTPDAEPLPIPEEPGHIDANCYALFGRAIRYIHMCAMMPKPLLQVNDRILQKVFSSRFEIAFTNKRTVGYATRWSEHYRFLGREIPSFAKPSTGEDSRIWHETTPEDVKADWFEYLWQSKTY